jgi:hypothetical protein
MWTFSCIDSGRVSIFAVSLSSIASDASNPEIS